MNSEIQGGDKVPDGISPPLSHVLREEIKFMFSMFHSMYKVLQTNKERFVDLVIISL